MEFLSTLKSLVLHTTQAVHKCRYMLVPTKSNLPAAARGSSPLLPHQFSLGPQYPHRPHYVLGGPTPDPIIENSLSSETC